MNARGLTVIPVVLTLALLPFAQADDVKAEAKKEFRVVKTDDFEVTGDGSHPFWKKAEWVPLSPRNPDGRQPLTRVKMMYSKKGVYALMDAVDGKVTANFKEDFADLWTEDVFEVFLWPDERNPIYFEYEISPINRELPILVANLAGTYQGWRPWHYVGARKIRKATSATGGPAESNATITGWKAEFFIPFELLKPMQNVPPTAGTRWRANFYRVDYDGGQTMSWDWSRVGPSFHEFEKFGTLIFE